MKSLKHFINRNAFKSFFAVVLVLLVSSCEKDLDLEPKDELSSTLFFQKADDFKTWINNSYNDLPAFLWGLDHRADLSYQPGGNSVSRGIHQTPDADGFWGGSPSICPAYQ